MSKKKQIDCNEIMEKVRIGQVYTFKKRNLKVDIFQCDSNRWVQDKEEGGKMLIDTIYYQTCYHFKKERRKEICLEYDLNACVFNFIKRLYEL